MRAIHSLVAVLSGQLLTFVLESSFPKWFRPPALGDPPESGTTTDFRGGVNFLGVDEAWILCNTFCGPGEQDSIDGKGKGRPKT